MDLRKYIDILYTQKTGWLFQKDNTAERLEALDLILKHGHTGIIAELVACLKDTDAQVRKKTFAVIDAFYTQIDTKKELYNTLRYCPISKADLDFYAIHFSKNQYFTLLAIASQNSSGHVREKALNALVLTGNAKAIPFLMYRLADWVQPIREQALKALHLFRKAEFAGALIEHMELFEWLQKVERTNLKPIYEDFLHFILVENQAYVLQHFGKFSDKNRIIIARYWVRVDCQPNVVQLMLADSHFLVRSLALHCFGQLSPMQKTTLLQDKSSKIRMQVLYKLDETGNASEVAASFLADSSATIRSFARFKLKDSGIDFAAYYHDNLIKTKNTIGSLFGLTETEGKPFIASVLAYLEHPKTGIRKAAFLALQQLDEAKAYHFALQNLGSGTIGLRNSTIDYLKNYPNAEVLEKARQLYQDGNPAMKKAMLTLFSKIGRYKTVADLMIGTIDNDENVRNMGRSYLKQWLVKSNRYFTAATMQELERSNQVFRLAHEIHEQKKYFDQNPLDGLDFYLQ